MVRTADNTPIDKSTSADKRTLLLDILRRNPAMTAIVILLITALAACSPPINPTPAIVPNVGTMTGEGWTLITNKNAVSFPFVVTNAEPGTTRKVASIAPSPRDNTDVVEGGVNAEKKVAAYQLRVNLAGEGEHLLGLAAQQCLETVCGSTSIPVKIILDQTPPVVGISGTVSFEKGQACFTLQSSEGGTEYQVRSAGGIPLTGPLPAMPDGTVQACLNASGIGKNTFMASGTDRAGNTGVPTPIEADYHPEKGFQVQNVTYNPATRTTSVDGFFDPKNSNLSRVLRAACTSQPFFPGIEATADGNVQLEPTGKFHVECKPVFLDQPPYDLRVTFTLRDASNKEFTIKLDGESPEMPGLLKAAMYLLATVCATYAVTVVGTSAYPHIKRERAVRVANTEAADKKTYSLLAVTIVSQGTTVASDWEKLTEAKQRAFNQYVDPVAKKMYDVAHPKSLNSFLSASLEILKMFRYAPNRQTALNSVLKEVALSFIEELSEHFKSYQDLVDKSRNHLYVASIDQLREEYHTAYNQIGLLTDFYSNLQQVMLGAGPLAELTAKDKGWQEAMNMLRKMSMLRKCSTGNTREVLTQAHSAGQAEIIKLVTLLMSFNMKDQAMSIAQVYGSGPLSDKLRTIIG